MAFRGRSHGRPRWIESSATEDSVYATIWYEHELRVPPGYTSTLIVTAQPEFIEDPSDPMAALRWHSTYAPEGTSGPVYTITPFTFSGDGDFTPLGQVGEEYLSRVNALGLRRQTLFGGGAQTYYGFAGTGGGDPPVDVTRLETEMGPFPPASPFVTGVRASTTLAGNATVLGARPGSGRRWYRTDYGPESLFDGIASNAWVEGVDGSGIGEWVEFELTSPIVGLSIYNGIQMYTGGIWRYDFSRHNRDREYYEGIWGQNNRVSRVTIEALETGYRKRIDLADERTPTRLDTLFLPAGRYRMTVEAVYPGSRWDDTCLGELELGNPAQFGTLGDESWLMPMLEGMRVLDRQLDRPDLR